MATMTIAKAINEGLRASLTNNPKSLLMGEDIGHLGGVYRVTDGLIKEFGDERVLDTPLAESGIVGTAIGLALRGYSPVCEIQFDGFVYPAFNQITTQLAKIHARSLGKFDRSRGHPHSVRRRHRIHRASLRIPGSAVRPHCGPAHHFAVQRA